MADLIELNHQAVLNSLKKRKTAVGAVYRAVGIGALLLVAGESAYIASREYTEQTHRGEARRVTDSLRSVVRTGRQSADSLQALLAQVRQEVRRDSITYAQMRDQVNYSIPLEVASRNHCGEKQTVISGSYTALRDKCTLDATIPSGGSISGAALAFFGDVHRWKQDYAKNSGIASPDWVEPGTTYRFTLP